MRPMFSRALAADCGRTRLKASTRRRRQGGVSLRAALPSPGLPCFHAGLEQFGRELVGAFAHFDFAIKLAPKDG
jgi:hypothetical protein